MRSEMYCDICGMRKEVRLLPDTGGTHDGATILCKKCYQDRLPLIEQRTKAVSSLSGGSGQEKTSAPRFEELDPYTEEDTGQ